MHDNLQKVFNEIAEENKWGDVSSLSGTGSNLARTEIIRKKIPELIRMYNVKTFVDAPCGDFFWMKEIQPEMEQLLTSYVGVDIVESLMARNQQLFGSDVSHFLTVNIAQERIPKADMVFTRDCLVHLSYDNIYRVLNNFKKSGTKYLLTTTFPGRVNKNIKDGDWRPLNLEATPFFFPAPLLLINEDTDEDGGIYRDKSLALWKLEDVPGFSRWHYFKNCLLNK